MDGLVDRARAALNLLAIILIVMIVAIMGKANDQINEINKFSQTIDSLSRQLDGHELSESIARQFNWAQSVENPAGSDGPDTLTKFEPYLQDEKIKKLALNAEFVLLLVDTHERLRSVGVDNDPYSIAVSVNKQNKSLKENLTKMIEIIQSTGASLEPKGIANREKAIKEVVIDKETTKAKTIKIIQTPATESGDVVKLEECIAELNTLKRGGGEGSQIMATNADKHDTRVDLGAKRKLAAGKRLANLSKHDYANQYSSFLNRLLYKLEETVRLGNRVKYYVENTDIPRYASKDEITDHLEGVINLPFVDKPIARTKVLPLVFLGILVLYLYINSIVMSIRAHFKNNARAEVLSLIFFHMNKLNLVLSAIWLLAPVFVYWELAELYDLNLSRDFGKMMGGLLLLIVGIWSVYLAYKVSKEYSNKICGNFTPSSE